MASSSSEPSIITEVKPYWMAVAQVAGLEVAGLDAPVDRPFDGESLLPHLQGVQRSGARQLFWLGRAMREGRWKLVEQGDKALLSDVGDDIGEQRDLAAERPARVTAMRRALAGWRADVK